MNGLIIVLLDGSTLAEQALFLRIALARRMERELLLCVVPSQFYPSLYRHLREGGDEYRTALLLAVPAPRDRARPRNDQYLHSPRAGLMGERYKPASYRERYR